MGAPPKATDAQLLDAIRAGMYQQQILDHFGMSLSAATNSRLKRIAREAGLEIARGRPAVGTERSREFVEAAGVKRIRVDTGVVLVGSDAHFLPGVRTTAFRAFVKFCKEMRPRAVVMNGDSMDGASISRWPRIGWQHRPTVKDELAACIEAHTEVEMAAGTRELYWPLGNHDARFETFLASRASEYEGVVGFRLKDHFSLWIACWGLWVNDDVMIKHRWKGGDHATHNNTLRSGKTMVTGHLHSLKVTPYSDLNGTRFGVDCGTLAQPYGEAFLDYTEGGPVNWRSGFVVLTFRDSMLMWPEVVHVINEEAGLVQFRGQVIRV